MKQSGFPKAWRPMKNILNKSFPAGHKESGDGVCLTVAAHPGNPLMFRLLKIEGQEYPPDDPTFLDYEAESDWVKSDRKAPLRYPSNHKI